MFSGGGAAAQVACDYNQRVQVAYLGSSGGSTAAPAGGHGSDSSDETVPTACHGSSGGGADSPVAYHGSGGGDVAAPAGDNVAQPTIHDCAGRAGCGRAGRRRGGRAAGPLVPLVR